METVYPTGAANCIHRYSRVEANSFSYVLIIYNKRLGNRLTHGCGELYSPVFIRIVLFLKKRLGSTIAIGTFIPRQRQSVLFSKKICGFGLTIKTHQKNKRTINSNSIDSPFVFKIIRRIYDAYAYYHARNTKKEHSMSALFY